MTSEMFGTCIVVKTAVVLKGCPVSPLKLLPHAQTVPSVLTATEKNKPAEIARTFVRPGIWTGVSEPEVVPVPSCPPLFPPKPHTVPSDLSAIEWAPPAEIAVTFDRPGSCDGTAR